MPAKPPEHQPTATDDPTENRAVPATRECDSGLSRRAVLGTALLSVSGAGLIGAGSRARAETTGDETAPFVNIEPQETAGKSVTIEAARSNRRSFLFIKSQYEAGGVTRIYDSGMDLRDVTFTFQGELTFDQPVTVELYVLNGDGVIAEDTAPVTVRGGEDH